MTSNHTKRPSIAMDGVFQDSNSIQLESNWHPSSFKNRGILSLIKVVFKFNQVLNIDCRLHHFSRSYAEFRNLRLCSVYDGELD
jgi:hypothetical protein